MFRATELYCQNDGVFRTEPCRSPSLILACIVYWQAGEISRLAAAPDLPFDPDLLCHVSPIEWKNVILYREIKIDPAKLKMLGS